MFISYTTHGDTFVAELLRDVLRKNGIDCWYAPDSLQSGDFAAQIVDAIGRCTHYVCIVSKNSITSQHMMNELDLAFKRINYGITILPFVLDTEPLNGSFSYYLSRIQHHHGYPEPLEQRIAEFVDKIRNSLI